MEYVRYIMCYTRKPQDEMIYSSRLAFSMHLAYSEDGKNYEALNHNSGVLFAKATENEDNTLNAKSLKCPFIFSMENSMYGVLAVRTDAEGGNDAESRGKVLFFATKDFLQYQEVGLIDLNTDDYVQDVACIYDAGSKEYIIFWCDEQQRWYRNVVTDLFTLKGSNRNICNEQIAIHSVDTGIEGIVPRNSLRIPEHIGKRLKYKLSTPFNTAVEVPEEVIASSRQELKGVKVRAIYNDGTAADKTVDWDDSNVDWNRPGTYQISGTIHQDHYEFPVAVNRADPCITKWNGKYYFIATNDEDKNHTLYIREADSIPELVGAKEILLLDSDTYPHIKGLLWAPEFHVIEDDLYIFHGATSSEFFYEESHLMKLKRGGNPANREDWSAPQRILKKDGSYLCEEGKVISLDMTVIRQNNEYYAAWSQRQFLPVDTGAWLYIARLDKDEPWKLATDPVVISKPDYGWANNHTFVDEGPYALITDKKIFLTFSSALVDATYVVGLLTADPGSDLLDPKSWTKLNYPLLTSRSVPGEFGPGHNSYVTDDDGIIWNAYHARPGVDGPRSSGIRRVHFDIDGYPVLDLTERMDLDPKLKKVSTRIVVKA